MEDLKALQIVDLSHNQISSLQGLENHDFLEVINVEDNKVISYFMYLGFIVYIRGHTRTYYWVLKGCHIKCQLAKFILEILLEK